MCEIAHEVEKKCSELLPFVNLDIESLLSQKLLQLGASTLDS